MSDTVTLQPGAGDFDITSYPLGGCFRRAPKDTPTVVSRLEVLSGRGDRCDRIGDVADARRIAFSTSTTVEGEAARRADWIDVA